MSDDGNGAKAKKRRKDPLPDFRTIQYERPVAKKDFIKSNAANAKRNIVMKKEPKRIFIRDNENNEEVIREEHFRRRSSVKPSYMNRDTYGKIPKYLAKRKTDDDGEPDQDALEVKSTIPKKSVPARHTVKPIDTRKTVTREISKEKPSSPPEKVQKSIRKSVKLDNERHTRLASKLGDEPVPKRRSSSRIPRRNSSGILPSDGKRYSTHQKQIRRGSRIPVSQTDLKSEEEYQQKVGRQTVRTKKSSSKRWDTVRDHTVHKRKSQSSFHNRPDSPKYAPPPVRDYTMDRPAPRKETKSNAQSREFNDLKQAGILNYNWPMAYPFGATQMLLPPIPMSVMPGPQTDFTIEGKLKRLEQLERYYQHAHIQHLQAMASAAQHSSIDAHRKTKSKEPFKIVKGEQDGTWLLRPSESEKSVPNTVNSKTTTSTTTAGETPYIIATTQNIYIPADYPIIKTQPPGPINK